jgi:hypothetical protein
MQTQLYSQHCGSQVSVERLLHAVMGMAAASVSHMSTALGSPSKGYNVLEYDANRGLASD